MEAPRPNSMVLSQTELSNWLSESLGDSEKGRTRGSKCLGECPRPGQPDPWLSPDPQVPRSVSIQPPRVGCLQLHKDSRR